MPKGTIAPHLNSEVRLVLGGHKPLASIEKDKDPYGYSLAIALSGTGALSIAWPESGNEVVFTLPSKKAWIEHYFWLLKNGVKLLGVKEYHRRMGKVFGYTDEDIEAFIKSDIHCECNKCRGN